MKTLFVTALPNLKVHETGRGFELAPGLLVTSDPNHVECLLTEAFRLLAGSLAFDSPSSTSALTVVCSCAARRFACSSSELGISTVVFIWIDVSEYTARLQARCAH